MSKRGEELIDAMSEEDFKEILGTIYEDMGIDITDQGTILVCDTFGGSAEAHLSKIVRDFIEEAEDNDNDPEFWNLPRLFMALRKCAKIIEDEVDSDKEEE